MTDELVLPDARATREFGNGQKVVAPEAVAKTVRALPTQTGAQPVTSSFQDSVLFFVSQVADEFQPWGQRTKVRDAQLRAFISQESYSTSALGVVTARNAAFNWRIEGSMRTAARVQQILEECDDGRGWESFITKVSQDLYTQDSGGFIEVVREKDEPASPLITLNHLDAARCYHTGDPLRPVIYQDRKNEYHLLHWWNVIPLAEMPVAIEGLNGYQFCAFTRLLIAAQIMRNIEVYKKEKCRVATDQMMLADGSWTPFSELVGKKFDVLSFDEQKAQFKTAPAFAEDNGVQSCLLIRTKRGREHRVTYEHPFLTYHGWREAQHLRAKDRIAIPEEVVPDAPGANLSDDELSFLAYMIGDGCCTGKKNDPCIRFSQLPGPLLNDMNRICDNWGLRLRYEGRCSYVIRGPCGGAPNQNRALNLLRETGLFGHRSGNKFVPQEVFRGTNEQIALFINRLFACDGSVCGNGVSYATISAQLGRDVWRLLLRFGIHARLARKPCEKCSTGESWWVVIEAAEDVRKFIAEIGILGKEHRFASLIDEVRERGWTRRTVEGMPPEFWGDVLPAKQESGATYEDIDLRSCDRDHPISQGRLAVAEKVLEIPRLSYWLSAPVLWDEIVEVREIGRLPTVAVTVPETGTYLTETIEHNTGGRNTRAIHLVQGLSTEQINDALASLRNRADTEGLRRYVQPAIVGSHDPQAKIDVKTLELTTLPDSFDEDTAVRHYIAMIAMAFGSDYQEFAPLPGGNLGTSMQSQILHMKSRGKGPGLFMKLIRRAMNQRILPKNTQFVWEEQDLEADEIQAKIRKTRAEEREIRVRTQEINPHTSRLLALEEGDLTQEMFDAMEEAEEEAALLAEQAVETSPVRARVDEGMGEGGGGVSAGRGRVEEGAGQRSVDDGELEVSSTVRPFGPAGADGISGQKLLAGEPARAGPFEAERLRDEAVIQTKMEKFLRKTETKVRQRLRQDNLVDVGFRSKALTDVAGDDLFWAARKKDFMAAVGEHPTQIVGEGVKQGQALGLAIDFNRVNQQVLDYTLPYTNRWWAELEKDTRRALKKAIAGHIESGAPLKTLNKQIAPLFGKARAEMIARTEVTRMYAEGNRISYADAGVQEVKWRTVSDARVDPACEELHNKVMTLGQEEEVPPLHPRCRCWLAAVSGGRTLDRIVEKDI